MGRGRINVKERKIYSLVYADDLVLFAEKEEEMRRLIERLEGCLDRKKLELNVGKIKILRCRRGGGKRVKRTWRCKKKIIEEVKEFKYLGYVL